MGALQGRTALITGAAKGIGRAIAVRFAAEGARLALLDQDGGAVAGAAREIGGGALGLQADVGDPAEVEAAVAEALAALGEVTVLVNNAAAPNIKADVTRLNPRDWDHAIRVSLTGSYLVSRAVLPSMIRAGGGAVINIASQLGRVAIPASPAYCAAKGGLIQLTRAMALDHAAQGIRVNALSPGAVLTDRLTVVYGSAEAASAALSPGYPLGRLGVPEDLTGAAVFLASDEARFMTGADLVVDGGYTAR